MPTEIDSITSLAFSISANKGVYALLLGSGVSRTSKIPTGWEITLDLVRKLAALQGDECEPDPATWYQGKFGTQPDYSALLDVLCKSPAERQQLIRGYLEPTEEERNEGLKQPTAAHRAIAELVKGGFVRVILTTNFDKLTELALQDVGIVPTVLSSVDLIAGALPLVHTACTIVKIHGDYLDTRIRNTSNELADYPDEFNKLLDRIFDEYGLIVCGWSAEWDEALRRALIRAPYRRFSTYWASRGVPGSKALELIRHRSASLVNVSGADSFFVKLAELVHVLDSFSKPHPLSTAAAVATVKKFLSEDKYSIQLDDLITEEVDRAIGIFNGSRFDVSARQVDSKLLGERVQSYEATSINLVEMAIAAGYWSTSNQLRPWIKAIARLSQRKHDSGLDVLIEFQRYPACLVVYAIGLAAVAADNLTILRDLFSVKIVKEHQGAALSVVALNPISMFQRGVSAAKLLPGKDRHFLPLNSWLEDFFSSITGRLFQNNQEFRDVFDKFEFLWTLAYARSIPTETRRFWVPFGNFIYRDEKYAELDSEIRGSLTRLGGGSPYVISGIFGSSVIECTEMLDRVSPVAADWARQRW